eukprot:2066438-Ditylum_brightwellii.AAC.1
MSRIWVTNNVKHDNLPWVYSSRLALQPALAPAAALVCPQTEQLDVYLNACVARVRYICD